MADQDNVLDRPSNVADLMTRIPWWIGIVSVTVTVPNAPMTIMNDHIRTLILGNAPCRLNGLVLGIVNGCYPCVPLSANGPLAIAIRYDVLVLAHPRCAADSKI